LLLFQGAIFQISADVSTKLSHQGWNTDYTTDRRLGLLCTHRGGPLMEVVVSTSPSWLLETCSYVHCLLCCMAKRYLTSLD